MSEQRHLRALTCTCGKPTSESAFICEDCKAQLWQALGDAGALVVELDVNLAKQQRYEVQGATKQTGHEQPLPFDTGASAVLHELRAELVGLVRLCVEQGVPSRGGAEDWPADNLAAISGWLLWRVDGIATQPWAADALRLAQLTAKAERVIDRPPDRTFAGPCDECGRDLYAQHGAATVDCQACGLTYDLSARRQWLLAVVHDRLASSTEIARALTSLDLPVTGDRIRQWKHRGRIDVAGHDRLGRPLFRVGDIVTLLSAHAAMPENVSAAQPPASKKR